MLIKLTQPHQTFYKNATLTELLHISSLNVLDTENNLKIENLLQVYISNRN